MRHLLSQQWHGTTRAHQQRSLDERASLYYAQICSGCKDFYHPMEPPMDRRPCDIAPMLTKRVWIRWLDAATVASCKVTPAACSILQSTVFKARKQEWFGGS